MMPKPLKVSPLRAPITWMGFQWVADDWFVEHAICPSKLTAVKLSSLAFAVEMYLKGCIAKSEFLKSGDHAKGVAEACAFSHNLKKLLERTQNDCSILTGYELRQELLDVAFIVDEEHIRRDLPAAWDHYSERREFYLIANFAADLKYLGLPMAKPMHPNLSFSLLPQYWIKFFLEMRQWLKLGSEAYADRMSILVHSAHEIGIADHVVAYLKGLGTVEYSAPQLLYGYHRLNDETALEYRRDSSSHDKTNLTDDNADQV